MQGIVLGTGTPLGTASPPRQLRAGLALLGTAGMFDTRAAAPGWQGRGSPAGAGSESVSVGSVWAQPGAGS